MGQISDCHEKKRKKSTWCAVGLIAVVNGVVVVVVVIIAVVVVIDVVFAAMITFLSSS